MRAYFENCQVQYLCVLVPSQEKIIGRDNCSRRGVWNRKNLYRIPTEK